jgi:hypothetical protein
MRLDGYLEILGCIGLKGKTSWHRCKRGGIPFRKDPKTRGVWSTSDEVTAWWKRKRETFHVEQGNRCRRHQPWVANVMRRAMGNEGIVDE